MSKPLRGVVIGGGRMLLVKMASGRTVEVPHTKGVSRWDAVDVHWDYVKNRAASVEVRNPDADKEAETPEENSWGAEGEDSIEEDESSLVLDSGALEQACVESGGSGDWVLELSDGFLMAGGCM